MLILHVMMMDDCIHQTLKYFFKLNIFPTLKGGSLLNLG